MTCLNSLSVSGKYPQTTWPMDSGYERGRTFTGCLLYDRPYCPQSYTVADIRFLTKKSTNSITFNPLCARSISTNYRHIATSECKSLPLIKHQFIVHQLGALQYARVCRIMRFFASAIITCKQCGSIPSIVENKVSILSSAFQVIAITRHYVMHINRFALHTWWR
jgi:hypothetical protein